MAEGNCRKEEERKGCMDERVKKVQQNITIYPVAHMVIQREGPGRNTLE